MLSSFPDNFMLALIKEFQVYIFFICSYSFIMPSLTLQLHDAFGLGLLTI